MNEEVFQAKRDMMKSIETFLKKFNCIPFEEKPPILLQAWFKIFAIQYSKPEDPNELFQKLLEDLKELAEYDNSPSRDRSNFLNDDEDHSDQNKKCLENSSKEIAVSNSNKEKEEPPQTPTFVSSLKKNVAALNTKLLSINSQRLDNKEQEVKKVVEQPAERGNLAPILSTKEPEYSHSMGYENSNTTLETESDEIIKSGVEELVPTLSENEVTLEDKRECDVPISENSPICDDHSEIFSDSKNDDDISVYDDFEDIEYVEASLSDPEIVEEENVVHEEEEEVDLEDISQIQDVDLREKLLSITRFISNIESLNNNPTPDRVLNSFASDNSLSDNFSPEFETFCDHTEETRSGNTTHSNISDDSSNDPLLEEADLFLAFDNSIPPGIENFANDSEGDVHFLEELLIDDSILSHESSDSNFEDNPSVPLPPPEPPDVEFDAGKEIPVVMNDKDEDVDYSSFIFVIYPEMFSLLLFAESEDTIFNLGFALID
nr:hypothetical protein [Tanacetum cinerariifolium]